MSIKGDGMDMDGRGDMKIPKNLGGIESREGPL